MDFDFFKFVETTAQKVANQKGYDNVGDLLTGSAAKNIARITDKANETKQTPPVVEPTAYVQEMLAEQSPLGISNGKLLLIGGGIVIAAALLLTRKRGK